MKRPAAVAALAAILAASSTSAQTPSPPPTAAVGRPAPATPGNLSREEKRCNAALRRVERHRASIEETRKSLEASRIAADACASKRACEQASHREKALRTRLDRQERQLSQLDAESRGLCAAPGR